MSGYRDSAKPKTRKELIADKLKALEDLIFLYRKRAVCWGDLGELFIAQLESLVETLDKLDDLADRVERLETINRARNEIENEPKNE